MQKLNKRAEGKLQCTENYKRLNLNPTTTDNDIVNKIITRFPKESSISKSIANGLKTGLNHHTFT